MSSGKPTILVTGGAGYIGSHTVLALKQVGYEVVILDNLVYGHRDLVEKVLQVELVVGDTNDRALLDKLFTERTFDAVMHFSAYAYVGESVVFSSTCATYGVPSEVPIPEDHPQNPINPYGATKLMVERILTDFDVAYGLKSVRFRYFNAAGADPNGNLGEDHNPETHLIPLVLQTALGVRESVSIFGTDYPTPDGTCIRDYIHVSDLADAHILGLEYLLKGGNSAVFNLGNGSGFSVREVIDTAKKVTGKQIKVIECERRPGDPPALIGSGDKARQTLGWEPKYAGLEDILTHAWNWHQKRHA